MGRTISKKPAAKKIQDLYPEAFTLAFNIEQFARRYGTTPEELAEAILSSEDTFERRMKQPWKFTVHEITSIARLWGMTPAQLMTEPKYIVEPVEVLV